ncbi:hypothetical protein DL98DRAFT_209951 [Cadophora sp. DSE1049]|nr:hypothetical protein DL98DRAFT_209951 [Cadophora sp. DSE1049]
MMNIKQLFSLDFANANCHVHMLQYPGIDPIFLRFKQPSLDSSAIWNLECQRALTKHHCALSTKEPDENQSSRSPGNAPFLVLLFEVRHDSTTSAQHHFQAPRSFQTILDIQNWKPNAPPRTRCCPPRKPPSFSKCDTTLSAAGHTAISSYTIIPHPQQEWQKTAKPYLGSTAITGEMDRFLLPRPAK